MNSDKIKFLMFIVVASTIGQIAAEIYVPSLPFISHDFQVSNSLVQISIAVFLFGMGVPGIFFGYISDYFGRRKILLITTSISSLGTLLCVIAPNIYILILGRLVQGLGFSGVGSIGRAILRDRMSGVDLAKYASNLAIITVLVVDLSPFVGGFLQEYFGWRPIFAILFLYNLFAIYASYQFHEEHTRPTESLQLSKIFITTWQILHDKTFVKYNLLSSLTYAAIMLYLAVASFLFEGKLGLSPTEFGTTTLGLSFVFMFGSFLNGRLLHYLKIKSLIQSGVTLMCLAAFFALALATILPLTYIGLIVFVALVYLASSALFSNSSALAFSNSDKSVGIASALYSSLQVLTAAVFSALISLFHVNSTLPLAIFMLIIVAVMVLVLQIKSHENIQLENRKKN